MESNAGILCLVQTWRRALSLPLILACAGCGLLPTTDFGGFSPQAANTNPLACKLLKASAYAYNVNSTGAIQSDTGLANLMGEAGDAFGVSGSDNGQTDSDRDAAFIWRSDNEVIIAFRGTLPYKE